MSGFATSLYTIKKNVLKDELNAVMAGPFFETPLTSISYPASDSDSDSESVDFADGWTCRKSGYITAQEHTTCRKCDHGCCADCED